MIFVPAFIDNNDIIIKDRKNEIFPNNVTLCENSCEYQGVSIEDKRIVCECNINRWINKSNENNNYFPNEEKDKDNLFNYLLDNINYKPFKCIKLLFSFDNSKYNYGFYCLLIIILIIIINIIIFAFFRLPKIRAFLHKEMPINFKIKRNNNRDIGKSSKKIKINKKNNIYNSSTFLNKFKSIKITQNNNNKKWMFVPKNIKNINRKKKNLELKTQSDKSLFLLNKKIHKNNYKLSINANIKKYKNKKYFAFNYEEK